MRKRQLLELNHELYNSLESVKASAEELRSENIMLRKSLSELEKEIELLKVQNPVSEIDDKKPENIAVENEFPVKPEISDEMEYAAAIIGKIVISAAKYCSKLGSMQDNPDSKELINLILGRTEVAKAEILKMVSSENSIEVKNELMNNELSNAEDYFQSVFAQNG